MYEALLITLPMALGGSLISFLLYKVVHLHDKVETEVKAKPKKTLYKSKRIPLKIVCDEKMTAILRAKARAQL